MEISSPTIDGKICKTKDAGSSTKFGEYAPKTNLTDGTDHTVALCGGKGDASASGRSDREQVFKDFVAKTLTDGSQNWPTSTSSGTGTKKQSPVTNDNAKAVAGDLTKLTPEEKTIVAGLLAKTIEGGEVVEIRAVSSTSVIG
ncbi:hypothetical protein ANAPC1_00892 [Anaplasma phagocytophilum]|uniref:Uncharacterized protein n=1 Tax=Anaplasma phagocytophilum TaxID=948 RepID=A0AA45ZHU4_ANAPH|nr:hypothetical protein ANAPC1_00892 [Anaplasma phagocytophilum]